MEIQTEALENSLQSNIKIEAQNIISLNKNIFLRLYHLEHYKIWWVINLGISLSKR
jgi:hypothetical protein